MKSPRRSDLIPQWTHKQLQKRQIQNQLERNDLPEACRIEAVKMQRTVDGRRTESSVYARKKKYDFDEFCLIHLLVNPRCMGSNKSDAMETMVYCVHSQCFRAIKITEAVVDGGSVAKMRGQDQQSRVFYELCALLLSILRPPPPPSPRLSMPYSSSGSSMAVSPSRRTEVSAAGLASLLLGVSLALMLCGSVTFVIGFILMPWVLGMVMVFYLVGLVSNLSCLGRTMLLGSPSPTHRPVRKDMQGQFFSKLPIL
ncbi:hypothetical protein H6P81_012053 [Aristolochia fimbriata]|uniref:Uncharacterized protein n=1 Tax=Aristolochia fimbriata TaxID=158543 RepID=A0AAV7EAQ2_ARIFI|nr:hypothetical protein H6P81_012053 [Aristolochia fimbriata]